MSNHREAHWTDMFRLEQMPLWTQGPNIQKLYISKCSAFKNATRHLKHFIPLIKWDFWQWFFPNTILNHLYTVLTNFTLWNWSTHLASSTSHITLNIVCVALQMVRFQNTSRTIYKFEHMIYLNLFSLQSYDLVDEWCSHLMCTLWRYVSYPRSSYSQRNFADIHTYIIN
jgi:hypothetical protein